MCVFFFKLPSYLLLFLSCCHATPFYITAFEVHEARDGVLLHAATNREKKKKGERSTVASWHENTAQRSSYNPRRKPHRRTRKALIHQARKKMRFLSNSALFFFFVYLCVRFCFDSERRVENNMNRTSEIRHYTHKKKKRRPTRRTRSFVLAHVCRLYGR